MLRLTTPLTRVPPTAACSAASHIPSFSSHSESLKNNLASHFPGAMTGEEWLNGVHSIVNKEALDDNGFMLFSANCRDELMSSLTRRLESKLHVSSFAAHGVAGYISMGPAAWASLHDLAHAQGLHSRPNMAVVVNMAHIGITADGALGFCSRPGIPVPDSGPTPSNGACLALDTAMGILSNSEQSIPDDFELKMLVTALTEFKAKTPASIQDITITAERMLWSTTGKQVEDAIAGTEFKVLLFCGITIHTHDIPSWGDEYAIWQSLEASESPVAYRVIHPS